MYEVEVEREQEVGKYTAQVIHDPEGGYANPRENENLGTIITWGSICRDYSIGEEQLGYEPDFTIGCEACEGTGYGDQYEVRHYSEGVIARFDDELQAEAWKAHIIEPGFMVDPCACPKCEGTGEVEVEPEDYFRTEYDAVVVLPLDIRRDWSPTVRVSDTWEGADGAILTTVHDLRKGWGKWNGKSGAESYTFDPNETGEGEPVDWWHVIERIAPDALRGEIKEYDEWGQGEVYFWRVIDENGEVLDAVHGYIGDSGAEYALCEAFATAEWYIERDKREAAEAAHWAARDVETIA